MCAAQKRNPHAGSPFTSSDAEIAAALDDVSIPTLLLSCVHMSGDPSLLDGPLRPAGLFLNEVQGFISEDDKAAARRLALDVTRDTLSARAVTSRNNAASSTVRASGPPHGTGLFGVAR